MKQTNHFFATCSKGVEDLVLKELELLEISDTKIHTGGVAFDGDILSAYKACLWTRVASRILLQLKEFTISSDDDLYNEIISENIMLTFQQLTKSQQVFLEEMEKDDSEISSFVTELLLLSLLKVVSKDELQLLNKAHAESDNDFLLLVKRLNRKYEVQVKQKFEEELKVKNG